MADGSRIMDNRYQILYVLFWILDGVKKLIGLVAFAGELIFLIYPFII
jgi:hypothetical protein